MKNNNYTLDDIKKFLDEYNQGQEEPKEWVLAIPVIGRKMYQKSCLEYGKRIYFMEAYYKVLNASVEEQIQFINKMAPILDDYYANKSNKMIRKM